MHTESATHAQGIERIMRRAQEMGLDPQRVAVALNQPAPHPTEYQAVEDVQPRFRFGRSVTRRFSRAR